MEETELKACAHAHICGLVCESGGGQRTSSIVLQVACILFVETKSLFYWLGAHQVSESQGLACFHLLSAGITSTGNRTPTSTLLTELATQALELQMFKTRTKLLVDACVCK